MNINTSDKTVDQNADGHMVGIDAGTLNSIHDTQPVDGFVQTSKRVSFCVICL